jgi:redox-sensitive bicupin YhaK (pirin superfamily)
MIRVRRSHERGHFDHGWLDTYHTFSFGDYYDPLEMGFRVLRVLNEDVVQPATGFGRHGHRDMEILTYVLQGELTHQDSMGNSEPIRAGEFQRMTAGTGVLHSEVNRSTTEPVHLLQIWIVPERRGLEPGYEQRAFERSHESGPARLVASNDGREGSLKIHQDVAIRLVRLGRSEELRYDLEPGRAAWLQVTRGVVSLSGHTLAAGDGAAIEEDHSLAMTASANEGAEFLLFDLP